MTDENNNLRRAIFFDTSIFHKLIGNMLFLENFTKDFSDKYGRENFYAETTPFMLLEYLGVKIPEFDESDVVNLNKIKSIAKNLNSLKKKKNKKSYNDEIKKLKDYILQSAEKNIQKQPHYHLIV